ncbi:MAG: hypothetical protein A2V89_00025 [Gammaproteobacteria bacterium RBG_16_37_9]|nr:MAG: hypothetical protein A2V89_00025 [Gammaproteobacteria bacterium RBG_16_37_9]
MRAVGANELINITVLSRQQRGNPEVILDNSKFKKISKAQNTIIQNRSWFASPSARKRNATTDLVRARGSQ